MKQDWHKYDEQLLSNECSVKKNVSSEKNKEAIFSFEKDCIVRGITKARIIKYLYSLKLIDQYFKKDFDKVTKEDIINFVALLEKRNISEWTRHSYKVVLKRFFKWFYQCEDEYPQIVKWIKASVNKNKKPHLNQGELLIEEDVQKLIENAANLRDKAFIAILWETGCRIAEIATLTMRTVKFDEHGAILTVTGKTGTRTVRIINSTAYLTNWLNTHPAQNNDAPIWVNIGNVNRNQQLKYSAIRKMLNTLFNKALIKKPCNPHTFRHSRATYLANHLTEFQMNNYFGWTQGSNMPRTYVHLSGKDIDGTLFRLNGIQDTTTKQESILKPKKCQRCNYLNSYEHRFCSKCGNVIDIKEAIKLQEETELIQQKREFSDEIMNKLFADPDIQNLIKTKLIQKQTIA